MNFMSVYDNINSKMTPENASKIQKIIQEAGDYLGYKRFTLLNTTSHQQTLDTITFARVIEINK